MSVEESSQSVPSPGPTGYTMTRNGRLRAAGLPDVDRNTAIALHVSPFAFFIGLGPIAFVAPLVIWLVRREASPFVDDHGREVINYLLSAVLFMLLTAILIVPPFVIAVLVCINLVRGAVAAGNGEYFRFPMTIRFLGS